MEKRLFRNLGKTKYENKYVESTMTAEEQARYDRIKELEKLAVEYRGLIDGCTHAIFYDEEGYIYHSRYCGVCGKLMELI